MDMPLRGAQKMLTHRCSCSAPAPYHSHETPKPNGDRMRWWYANGRVCTTICNCSPNHCSEIQHPSSSKSKRGGFCKGHALLRRAVHQSGITWASLVPYQQEPHHLLPCDLTLACPIIYMQCLRAPRAPGNKRTCTRARGNRRHKCQQTTDCSPCATVVPTTLATLFIPVSCR